MTRPGKAKEAIRSINRNFAEAGVVPMHIDGDERGRVSNIDKPISLIGVMQPAVEVSVDGRNWNDCVYLPLWAMHCRVVDASVVTAGNGGKLGEEIEEPEKA